MTLPRRTPLQRTTPLRSTSPLRRGSPPVRASALPRSPMVPKRPVRSPEETHARAVVRRRSGGRCEGCPAAVATDYAHRQARSQGGPWCASNALHLCRACHRWAHAEPVMACSVGWSVRRGQDPATTPALLDRLGWVLLDPSGGITPIERGAA